MPGFVSRSAEPTICSKSPPSSEVGMAIGAAGCSIRLATAFAAKSQRPERSPGTKLLFGKGAAEIFEQAGGVIAEQNGAKALIIDGDKEVAVGAPAPRSENAGLCHRGHLVLTI
jgi:hypothetical protein